MGRPRMDREEAMSFDYILDKIERAEFGTDPFKHLYIEDFLSPVPVERAHWRELCVHS